MWIFMRGGQHNIPAPASSAARYDECMANQPVALTEENFLETVKTTDRIMVVYFAEWAHQSIAMVNLVGELAPDYANVVFATVDIVAQPNLAVNAGVRALPTTHFIHSGDVIEVATGLHPKSFFEDCIHRDLRP
jgi:thioredoxin-like negative regulator of GroEL